MARHTRRRNRRSKRRRVRAQRGAGAHYVATSLEFELPGRYPHTLSEEKIEEIKTKIGDYFLAAKVPFTYFGIQNNYHIFTTLRSKSAYFNLSGGSMYPTAGVFVDIELTLDNPDGEILTTPEELSSSDISNLKSKIRYMIKDSAQNLIYKGLFNNMHIFISDPNVIHGRQF